MITTDELAARLGEPGLKVLDVRSALADPGAGRAAWAAGHVPGAAYLDVTAETSDPDDSVAGQLGSLERNVAALAAAGVGPGDEVVAYDDAALFMAPRLAWQAEVLGLPEIRVLDGGWPRWVAEGRPVSTDDDAPAAVPAGPEPVREPRPGLRLTVGDVQAGGRRLVDARFDGTWDAAGAHIPGAVRLPSTSTIGPDGTLLPAEELRELAAGAGLDPSEPVTLYCGGGISATQTLIALRAAGFDDLAVYDGSWAEWGAREDLPKEPHGS